jgi:hypothetical protein
MYMRYEFATQLFKTMNHMIPMDEWCYLYYNIINRSRQIMLKIKNINKLRIGTNFMCNGFNKLNGKIPLEWFNLLMYSLKINCKILLLSILHNNVYFKFNNTD